MTFPNEPVPPEPDQEIDLATAIEARVKAFAVAAVDALPREYAEKLNNVQFFIRRVLSAEDSERLGMHRGSLYGLYEGIPLTRRGGWYNQVTPDRITIFWGPLVRDYSEEQALAETVKKVVYHEIGHYFGLNEDDLSHTSVK
jgi:predicted Zn-dependent protease with MMP-like domain